MTKILFTLLAMCSFQAMADDSFIIHKDGTENMCRSESTTIDPGAAADCAMKAYQGPFSRTEATELCQGARSVGPADCAIKAYQGPFSRAEAIQLCRRNGSVANADCAIKAYQGPYSKEESIRLCANDPHSVINVLNKLESADKTLFMAK